MKVQCITRNPFDSRFCISRLLFPGFKISFSLHPYLWKFEKHWKEFRLTICGINVHYKSKKSIERSANDRRHKRKRDTTGLRH
jgi:hypothetical protein